MLVLTRAHPGGADARTMSFEWQNNEISSTLQIFNKLKLSDCVCDEQSAPTSTARHIVQARLCFTPCTCIINCADTDGPTEVIGMTCISMLFR